MVPVARGLLNLGVDMAKDDEAGEQRRTMRSLVQIAMVMCEKNNWEYFV
jgi:hypothetical protein